MFSDLSSFEGNAELMEIGFSMEILEIVFSISLKLDASSLMLHYDFK